MPLFSVLASFYALSPVYRPDEPFILVHDAVNASLEPPTGVSCLAFLQRFRCTTKLSHPLEFRLHRTGVTEFLVVEPSLGFPLEFPQLRYDQRLTAGLRCSNETDAEFSSLCVKQQNFQTTSQIEKFAIELGVNKETIEARSLAIQDFILNLISAVYELSCNERTTQNAGKISLSRLPVKTARRALGNISDRAAEDLIMQLLESYDSPRWGIGFKPRSKRFLMQRNGEDLEKLFDGVKFRYFEESESTAALDVAFWAAGLLAAIFGVLIISLICVLRRSNSKKQENA